MESQVCKNTKRFFYSSFLGKSDGVESCKEKNKRKFYRKVDFFSGGEINFLQLFLLFLLKK